jgi:hypothetical protein
VKSSNPTQGAIFKRLVAVHCLFADPAGDCQSAVPHCTVRGPLRFSEAPSCVLAAASPEPRDSAHDDLCMGWGCTHVIACGCSQLCGYWRTVRRDMGFSDVAYIFHDLPSGSRVPGTLSHCCRVSFRRGPQAVRSVPHCSCCPRPTAAAHAHLASAQTRHYCCVASK